MEKQKKVLNVIKGYMSKFDIEQVTIIEDDKDSVIFSGDVEKFLHPCETMQNEAYRIKMTETKRYHQTILLVTHNEEIAQMAERIIRIEDGKVTGDSDEK